MSFLHVQVFFVDGCSAVSCDLGVFMRAGELRSFYSAFLSSDPTKLLFSFVLCLVSLVYNVLWAEAFHLVIQVEILVRNGCTDMSAQDVAEVFFLFLHLKQIPVFSFSIRFSISMKLDVRVTHPGLEGVSLCGCVHLQSVCV